MDNTVKINNLNQNKTAKNCSCWNYSFFLDSIKFLLVFVNLNKYFIFYTLILSSRLFYDIFKWNFDEFMIKYSLIKNIWNFYEYKTCVGDELLFAVAIKWKNFFFRQSLWADENKSIEIETVENREDLVQKVVMNDK